MNARNDNPAYTRTAIGLHWIVAALIAAAFIIGSYAVEMQVSPQKLKLFSWHKWVGVSIALLVVARIGWRLYRPPPELPAGMPGWERAAAATSHLLLYTLMLAVPVSGWLMSLGGRLPGGVFRRRTAARPGREEQGTGRRAQDRALRAQHHAAAVDRTARRGRAQASLPRPRHGPHAHAAVSQTTTDPLRENAMKLIHTLTTAGLLLAAAPSLAGSIDYGQSRIAFTFTQMNVPVEGSFGKFRGDMRFDEKRPEASRAEFEVDLTSIDTGAPDGDAEAQRKDWFDTAAHPSAKFVSTGVKRLAPDRYQITGKLTIKGRTHDITVPTEVSVAGNTRTVSGRFVLKRLQFAIGEGVWADIETVADEVQVRFRIVQRVAGAKP
ncbi:MAG: YceI family protein [Chromatiales bacterium]|nr:YceI family protein [Chromatiales bacterium]